MPNSEMPDPEMPLQASFFRDALSCGPMILVCLTVTGDPRWIN
jgi:hypothetical protein